MPPSSNARTLSSPVETKVRFLQGVPTHQTIEPMTNVQKLKVCIAVATMDLKETKYKNHEYWRKMGVVMGLRTSLRLICPHPTWKGYRTCLICGARYTPVHTPCIQAGNYPAIRITNARKVIFKKSMDRKETLRGKCLALAQGKIQGMKQAARTVCHHTPHTVCSICGANLTNRKKQ